MSKGGENINKNISEIIKSKRKQMGHSQSELASGICAQGTISMLENGITVPSTFILKELAKKLELDVIELVYSDQDVIEKTFSKVNELTAIDEHEKAYNELTKLLMDESIVQDSLKKKYYYYLGITSLLGLKDVKKADLIFKMIQDNFELRGDVEDILIFVGLGILNYEKNQLEESRLWFDRAMNSLKKETLFVETNIREILKIYYNLAKFYSNIFEFSTAMSLCEDGIFWANKLHSSYHLAYLLYEKAFVLYKTEKYVEAEDYYNKAFAVASITNHESLKKVIISDKEEYGIK